MSGPLKGLLVVAVEQAVAAPLCTMRLAEAGARVIKIERPEGDFARGYDTVVHGESAYFVWVNRGKESIALDLKQPEDAALLMRIIERADVFVQNLAPGAVTRLGFGSDALRAKFPRLITVDIAGFGAGPYVDRKAYDLLIQCESGLASITGSPDAPGRVGVSVCDIACGSYAHAAVLEALIGRGQSGEGVGIEVTLFDAMADWMNVPLLQYSLGREAPSRVGLNHPGIAPYGIYSCSGGHAQVVIAIQNEREWLRLCTHVLLQPELAVDPRFSDNPARVANRPALDAAIGQVFDSLTHTHLLERLLEAEIAFAGLNTVEELAVHPHLRTTTALVRGLDVALAAPPAKFSNRSLAVAAAVPKLDGQGKAIRHEFG